MGDSSSVMPVAMGIITFVVTLAFILSIPDLQDTTIEAPGDIIGKDSTDPLSFLGSGYISWAPANGFKIDNATNVSDCYYDWWGNANNKYERFTDPAYSNHHIDARVIRNNTIYRGGNDGGWVEPLRYLQIKYYNYIALDFFIEDWGIYHNRVFIAISYEKIEMGLVPDSNYSIVRLEAYNVSLMITGAGNAFTFGEDLWNNNYTIYLVQNPQPNYNDFLSVLWWMISFNDAWMPNAPFFAYIISFLIDSALIMILLFVIQGFIP